MNEIILTHIINDVLLHRSENRLFKQNSNSNTFEVIKGMATVSIDLMIKQPFYTGAFLSAIKQRSAALTSIHFSFDEKTTEKNFAVTIHKL